MMRVSQRLDYALRSVVFLAGMQPGDHIAAGELADRLSLPRRFVEQQVTVLARAGIIESRRGSGGGAALARPASEISVLDVVQALEDSVLDVPRQSGSAVADMWVGAASAVTGYFDSITIEYLSARQCELEALQSPVYSI